jgi:hypothetical protein
MSENGPCPERPNRLVTGLRVLFSSQKKRRLRVVRWAIWASPAMGPSYSPYERRAETVDRGMRLGDPESDLSGGPGNSAWARAASPALLEGPARAGNSGLTAGAFLTLWRFITRLG